MIEDLLFLVSFYSNDRDRLTLKLYCNIYFKFITDFKLCCINNYIISIKILSLTNDIFDWNWGLLCACWGGHRDLVDFMIKKGANDWNLGLIGACKGGACCAGGHCPHRDLVDFMIDKGANNWNGGLFEACKGNGPHHRNLVDLMIEYGANNWNLGLCGACRGGHYDLANFMIQNGADDWNGGLQSACLRGYRDLVNLMISKGATLCMHCHRKMDDHLI